MYQRVTQTSQGGPRWPSLRPLPSTSDADDRSRSNGDVGFALQVRLRILMSDVSAPLAMVSPYYRISLPKLSELIFLQKGI